MKRANLQILPTATKVIVSIIGILMMLFGLSGGFHPLHNVLHFVSGAAIIALLFTRPRSLGAYMILFGFFYAILGVVGSVDHETVDATFLHTPFHPGHIYIGLIGFALPGLVIRFTKVSLGMGIRRLNKPSR
jgi:hypothetical protein